MTMDPLNLIPNEEVVSPSAVSTNNALEQFILLAKGAKGAACIELIKQVLEAPGVHVFGELLAMPNIAELEVGVNSKYFNTLNLFAYGTYRQYLDNKEMLMELSDIMKKKLQHLTIVTMAIKNKCIPYNLLLVELDITNVRDLEDLIIEAIYCDIVHGKLDQKNKQLEIDYAIGRDIRPENVTQIVGTLQEWCESCETVLKCIEDQIDRANAEKVGRIKHKEQVEQEITNLKKALKTQAADTDEAMATDSREAHSGTENRKKSIKTKNSKGTGVGLKLQR